MFGYYRPWIAVFAVFGYLFGFSLGLSALNAVLMVPIGGSMGLFMAWLFEKQKFRIKLHAWWIAWALIGLAIANRALQWPAYGIIPFVFVMALFGGFCLFASGKGPVKEWDSFHRKREFSRPPYVFKNR
jgi:hypothetical protein